MSSNCKDFISYVALSTSTICFCLVIILYSVKSSGNVNILYIDEKASVIFKTDERFLSIGLDSSVIANGFKGFNMTDPRLITIIKNLSPAYIRVGGNLADRLIFSNKYRLKMYNNFHDGSDCSYEPYYCVYQIKPNFTMSGIEWISLNKLTKRANLRMIFDLNVLLRTESSWDPENAKKLIKFSSTRGFDLNFELGNEPNAFRHQFDCEVNATQLANDYRTLRNILKRTRYDKSLILGPSVTRPDPKHPESVRYLKEFLKSGVDIDVITWHHYYFNGRIAQPEDFLNLKHFDIFRWQLSVINEIRNSMRLDKELWIGETASAWGGGSPKYSDRFISTFLWIDKLGLAARNNISVVVKQSIYNGYYALIDDAYAPNPNYWISVLFKKFVGPKVLSCFNAVAPKVRLYCHCTGRFSSVTVYGINAQNIPAKVRIEGLSSEPDKVLQYAVTSRWTLLSKDVYVNGKLLQLSDDGQLPQFKPRIVNSKPYVVMPPYSVVFWVVPTKSNLCNQEV